jgi:hypothetical protein
MPQVRLFGAGTKGATCDAAAVLSRKSPAAATTSGNKSATVIAIASQRAGASAFNQPGAVAPVSGAQTVKACEWCGKRIARWHLFAYVRQPPLCSRKCIMAWFDRES